MVEYRTHGKLPFKIVVLHGGPGAWGEMAPVAKELSGDYGVIEPYFLEATLEGQLLELKQVINLHKLDQVVLIGFSWGAWLGYIFAATYPEVIRKLIMVGSGPYEHRYYLELQHTRESRMTPEQKVHYIKILNQLQDPHGGDKDAVISQLGTICQKIDQYDEVLRTETLPPPHFDLDRSTHFRQALNEVINMRKSGDLLSYAKNITCPVVAIHGDYDPHPANGVKIPLEQIIPNFSFILLEKCGHKPWTERFARSKFYQVLKNGLL